MQQIAEFTVLASLASTLIFLVLWTQKDSFATPAWISFATLMGSWGALYIQQH